MWQTSIGNRVLDGAEWDLFREALGCAWEFVDKLSDEEEQGFQTGVAAFDSLVPAQKLAMLALVGQALRDKTVPAPDRSAVAEATIAAVFATLCIFIEVETVAAEDLELVNDHPTFWRQRVLTAWREVEGAQDMLVSDASCNDLSEWEVLIDDLAKRVLWDDVYERAEEFLDADPEVARVQLQQTRIPADYFLVISPDPTADELADIYRTLERLAARPIGKQPFPGFSDG